MILKRSSESSTPKNRSISIKFCSISSPRPTIGIPDVIYVNRSKHSLSIWDETEGKFIEFFGSKQITTNSEIVESNNEETNSLYSFILKDETLLITDPNGIIMEIPIPDKDAIDERIRALEERISKLEELLG